MERSTKAGEGRSNGYSRKGNFISCFSNFSKALTDDKSNFTVRNSVEYCGFRYVMADCAPYNVRDELISIGVGVRNDRCGSDLYVAYKPGKVTGDVRVVPGRSLGK